MTSWTFGVEIEILAEPHTIRYPLDYPLYYGKLAAALRNRGLNAEADDLQAGYTKHSEHFDKWWITSDGSLGNINDHKISNIIAFEAVSPIVELQGGDWEDEIDTFWMAYKAVFHMPLRDPRCGSHIHIAPGKNKKFTMSSLKKMAFGIVFYEELVVKVLLVNRANNQWCLPNTQKSDQLKRCGSNIASIASLIKSAANPEALKDIMQDDRYVLWNFGNIVNDKSGTIEFRGGRGLRGEFRTKRWITFAVCFLRIVKEANIIDQPGTSVLLTSSPQALYFAVKAEAAKLGMDQHLPASYTDFNESGLYYASANQGANGDASDGSSSTCCVQ